jgi:hypothetical protein
MTGRLTALRASTANLRLSNATSLQIATNIMASALVHLVSVVKIVPIPSAGHLQMGKTELHGRTGFVTVPKAGRASTAMSAKRIKLAMR